MRIETWMIKIGDIISINIYGDKTKVETITDPYESNEGALYIQWRHINNGQNGDPLYFGIAEFSENTDKWNCVYTSVNMDLNIIPGRFIK